jgi:5-methylcytosine-specific restriction endonuclease McrA
LGFAKEGGEVRKVAKRMVTQKERSLVYMAAKGRCQKCGVELEKGWHCDHIVPFHKTGRSNVFEMQALCPTCNLKKGGKVDD